MQQTDPASDDRFTLPPGRSRQHANYLDNLAALWGAAAPLARRIEAVDAATPAAGLSAPDEPKEEIAGLLEQVDRAEQFAFHVYGFGPHLLELFDRTGAGEGEAVFAVFEPDVAHLRDALLRHDYSPLLASRRIVILTCTDAAEVGRRLEPLTSNISLGFHGVRHHPSVARDPAFFEQATQAVADLVSHTRTQIATTLQHGRRTTVNIAGNIAAYATTPGLERLAGAFSQKPAIIVAAGPSLRRNIDRLRDAAGRAVIIAVQTTLRPLLEAGVVPQFVTALDYHEISARFYERLPRDLPTELVAEPKVSPEVVRAWCSVEGRRLTFLGNDAADTLLRELRPRKPRLPAGATVAHLAFSLAEHLGCSTAILVGQDLGFSDGLAYVPGTSYDDVWRPETGRFCTFEMRQWEHIARDRAALRRVEDYQGNSTYTEQRLFTYLKQFEAMFARTSMRVVDATEGGVAKAHTVRMGLAEAIDTLCTDGVGPVPDYPDILPGAPSPEAVAACLRRRAAEAHTIAEICRETASLLDDIARAGGDQARVNRAISRIDALRQRLREIDPTYLLATSLTQRSEQERFRADRRIRAANLSPEERQRRQVERDRANVQAVLAAAEDLEQILSALTQDDTALEMPLAA